jgi:peptidoglycan/LPS O-acetylase OafA/YrhL
VLCALLALAMLQWAESWPVAVHLSMALLVGACVYREDHGLAPLLRLPALAFVGSVSYGVYLLHMLVKNALTKGLLYLGWPASKYWVFGLTVIGAVAVAALSFRYFESFFVRRKQRYARAPTSAATPAPTPDIGGSARWNQG